MLHFLDRCNLSASKPFTFSPVVEPYNCTTFSSNSSCSCQANRGPDQRSSFLVISSLLLLQYCSSHIDDSVIVESIFIVSSHACNKHRFTFRAMTPSGKGPLPTFCLVWHGLVWCHGLFAGKVLYLAPYHGELKQ